MAASELVLEIYKKETFVHVFFFFFTESVLHENDK